MDSPRAAKPQRRRYNTCPARIRKRDVPAMWELWDRSTMDAPSAAALDDDATSSCSMSSCATALANADPRQVYDAGGSWPRLRKQRTGESCAMSLFEVAEALGNSNDAMDDELSSLAALVSEEEIATADASFVAADSSVDAIVESAFRDIFIEAPILPASAQQLAPERAVKSEDQALILAAVRESAVFSSMSDEQQAKLMDAVRDLRPATSTEGPRPASLTANEDNQLALLEAMAAEEAAKASAAQAKAAASAARASAARKAYIRASAPAALRAADIASDLAAELAASLAPEPAPIAALTPDLARPAASPTGLDAKDLCAMYELSSLQAPPDSNSGEFKRLSELDANDAEIEMEHLADMALLTLGDDLATADQNGLSDVAAQLAPSAHAAHDVVPSTGRPMRNGAERKEWTAAEDEIIRQGVEKVGCRWRKIAAMLPCRSDDAVRNRWNRLRQEQSSVGSASLPDEKPTERPVDAEPCTVSKLAAPAETSASTSGPPSKEKECKEKASRVSWSKAEDQTILMSVKELGHKWNRIAERLPGRTDHAIRNRFHRLQTLLEDRQRQTGVLAPLPMQLGNAPLTCEAEGFDTP